jgi:hypothetical protein
VTSRVVKLDAGAHRLMVRMARESQAGHFVVALQRLDGKPAGLTFAPAQGKAPRWSGVKAQDADGLFSSAESVRYALEPEGGDALARVLAARDALSRDPDGARALLAGLPRSVARPWRCCAPTPRCSTPPCLRVSAVGAPPASSKRRWRKTRASSPRSW